MNNGIEKKQFNLYPIGETLKHNGSIFLILYPDYKAALKHLDLFSHAIIFMKPKNDDNDKGSCQFGLPEKLTCIVVKLVDIDIKKGLIQIDDDRIDSYGLLYDIKPYIPCEDRVKDLLSAKEVEEGKWRKETSSMSQLKELDSFNIEEDRNKGIKTQLESIGFIRKVEKQSYIELFNEHIELISKLEQYSHLKVIWWFDKFDKINYRKMRECNPPYENAPKTGVFATRSPVRPNPIALTTVKITDVDKKQGVLKVSFIEAFNETPIIGLVPYLPEDDRVKVSSVPDWMSHWPQWLDDEGEVNALGKVKIIGSGLERLKKYLIIDEQENQDYKEFFKEESRSSNHISNDIEIIGARQNNLKNISCTIPKNKLTVITGVSGSGKSSLAFDTIFAESQRRFMDSLSVSGRSFFEQIQKPDIDHINGLPPAIAIEQKSLGRNPRSTVGTVTDIYDFLKLLFSKIGIRHCPKCKKALVPLKIDDIVTMLYSLASETKYKIMPYGKKMIIAEFTANNQKNNTEQYNIIKKSVSEALDEGNGAMEVIIDDGETILLQTKQMCFNCKHMFFHLSASTFSFNNPESMCPVCKGLGVKLVVDPNLIVSNPDRSILDEASSWWGNLRKHRKKPNANWMRGEILALADEMGVDLELPWKDLPHDFKNQAIYGSNGKEVHFCYENTNGRKGEIIRPVEGAYNTITRLFRENNGETANKLASTYMRESSCDECDGERLSAEGRLVSIGNKRFPETVIMSIEDLRKWIIDLPSKLSKEELSIAGQILRELKNRLESLIEAGVPYLTLDRSIPTLSGGEMQRLRLATQLGSGITNILYILDEPSIGLHAKDHKRLVSMIQKIKDEGNTVVVVEHDPEMMLSADKIIDIGPGAGDNGGIIIAEGSPEEIMRNNKSITGQFLKTYKNNEALEKKVYKQASKHIKITGAAHNNLKNIEVSFPLGVLTCVTGVSGSGKSSLVTKTLYPALARMLNKSEDVPGQYESINGVEHIDQIICISQQPIGRTPRSNPATYTGVFDEIRNLYASLEESRQKGYKQNKFSFNSKEGQCEACGGEGRKCIEMHFMPDVWIECSICHGKRFNKEALEIQYKGKTIADILDMTIETAFKFFNEHQKIVKIIKTLNEVGLGYLKLGQSALTLSGGEAQRIKLAKELSKTDTGRTLYILDEPTTGLHLSDVKKLLEILHQITEAGNTVIIIEHNMEVIKNSDWVIDLGPDGGHDGGYVVAQGTPIQVAQLEHSYTGQCLKM